jgi:hypothetical protein
MSKLDDLVLAPTSRSVCLRPSAPRDHSRRTIGDADVKGGEVQKRRAALEADLTNTNDRLSRLYRAIEDDIVDLDDQLEDRIKTLKTQRDREIFSRKKPFSAR